MGRTSSNTIVKFENGSFQDAAYFETKLLLKNSLQHEQRGAFTTTINSSTRLRSIINVPTYPAPNRELNLMF
ncbi:unnamed protein product [Adineta steineri]|uniref:Uncharacterized protein n=1 Tax=Adineta steineri TaxID=433720 RepID=A0A819WX02_9BILA|nr:unnamed protein product [Adineta steineri]